MISIQVECRCKSTKSTQVPTLSSDLHQDLNNIPHQHSSPSCQIKMPQQYTSPKFLTKLPDQDASPPKKILLTNYIKNMREYSLEMPPGKCPLKVDTVPIMPGYCRWQMANFLIDLLSYKNAKTSSLIWLHSPLYLNNLFLLL